MPEPKTRVLVVDDEADLLLLIAQVLQQAYEVVMATNGLEALDRLDRYEPDFVVIDVMMPVINGFDTTRAIKKDTRFSTVPVLFLTARKDNQAIREGMLSGADHYMEKPFQPEELLSRIAEIIEKQRVTPAKKSVSIRELEEQFGGVEALMSSTEAEAFEFHASTPGSLSRQLQELTREPRVRLLIVDDDLAFANALKAHLFTDYEVVTTIDPEMALDKIVAYQPDILLLDALMPKLDAGQLVHLLRLNKKLRDMKVLYMMGGSSDGHGISGNEMIKKPFTPEQLVNKLEEMRSRPDFVRGKKRLDFKEIQRREGDLEPY